VKPARKFLKNSFFPRRKIHHVLNVTAPEQKEYSVPLGGKEQMAAVPLRHAVHARLDPLVAKDAQNNGTGKLAWMKIQIIYP